MVGCVGCGVVCWFVCCVGWLGCFGWCVVCRWWCGGLVWVGGGGLGWGGWLWAGSGVVFVFVCLVGRGGSHDIPRVARRHGQMCAGYSRGSFPSEVFAEPSPKPPNFAGHAHVKCLYRLIKHRTGPQWLCITSTTELWCCTRPIDTHTSLKHAYILYKARYTRGPKKKIDSTPPYILLKINSNTPADAHSDNTVVPVLHKTQNNHNKTQQ